MMYGILPHSVRKRLNLGIVGYYFMLNYYIINSQVKKIKELSKKADKVREDERKRLANLISAGTDHSPIDCDNLCETHIIVQFIKELQNEQTD